MEIKSYGSKLKGIDWKPQLDNDGMEELKRLADGKDLILANLNGPKSKSIEIATNQYKGYGILLDELARISVSENGIKIQFSIGEEDIDSWAEYATLYIFDNGEIHYVFNGIENWNSGYIGCNKSIEDELNKKLGKTYALAKEKHGVMELISRTKSRNEKIRELCKLKVDAIISSIQRELEKNEEKTTGEVEEGISK